MARAGEPIRVPVDEEVLGESEGTEDFVFRRVGAPLPLFPSVGGGAPLFDRRSPPFRPLAVSDRHSAVFLAHPNGLLVVGTRDLVEACKEVKEKGKGRCVQDCCIIDVPIEGGASLVALSHDDSMVVAVGRELSFFEVSLLFNKEQTPFWSYNLSRSAAVKEFKWQKNGMSYVILSSDGTLHHGRLKEAVKEGIDNVDAVDFSPTGDYLVVARGNTLTILSPDFKEQCCLSLSFQSWTDHDSAEGIMKVDSIAWISDDSIAVGCYLSNEDGEETDYRVQLLMSTGKTFLEASSGPVVVSFPEIFRVIEDDILPAGFGPYLMLSYLDTWDIVVVSNKKSVDDHVVLLKLSSSNGKKNAVFLEFDNDKYVPRIDMQEDGEDNLVFGLSVERTTLFEKFSVQVGAELQDLAPQYILLCLTNEGKLIMYYIASLSDPSDLPQQNVPGDDHSELPQQNVTLEDLDSIRPQLCNAETSYGVTSSIYINSTDSKCPSTESPNVLGDEGLKLSSEIDANKNDNDAPLASDGQLATLAPKEMRSESLPSVLPPVSKSGSAALMRSMASSVPASQQISSASNSAFGQDGKENADAVNKLTGDEFSPLRPTLTSGPISVHGTTQKVGTGVGDSQQPTVSVGSYGNNTKNVNSGGRLSLKKNLSVVSPQAFLTRQNQIFGSIGQTTGVLSTSQSSFGSSFNSFAMEKSNEQLPTKTSKSILPSCIEYSEQDFTKKFYSVNDMTSELDSLLSCIEDAGGFRESCITSQERSVVMLENDMQTLFELTDRFKNSVKDQLSKMESLQNKMSQVSARKVYMEGIVSRLSDTQFWDVWSCQQLSPEFELKRQNILKANQILTHQLVELERHFNSLEINRSNEMSRLASGRRAITTSMLRTSRQTQLHGLRSTLSSQLAAAEQISESLSKQMTMLNINIPLKKRGNLTKELFEAIGLTPEVDASYFSATRPSPGSDSSKKSLKSTKVHLMGAVSVSEPETARRRRESLDRSLTSLEPQKTTVKRMSQQQRSKIRDNLSFRSSKEAFDSEMAAIVQQSAPISSSASLVESYFSKAKAQNEGLQKAISSTSAGSHQNSVFKWVRDSSGESHKNEPKVNEAQTPSRSSLQPQKLAFFQSAFSHVQENSASLSTTGSATGQAADRPTFSATKPFSYPRADTIFQQQSPTLTAFTSTSENMLAPKSTLETGSLPIKNKEDSSHTSIVGKMGMPPQKFGLSTDGDKRSFASPNISGVVRGRASEPSESYTKTQPTVSLAPSIVNVASSSPSSFSNFSSSKLKPSSELFSPVNFTGMVSGSEVGTSNPLLVSSSSASKGTSQESPAIVVPQMSTTGSTASISIAASSSSPLSDAKNIMAPAGLNKENSKIEGPLAAEAVPASPAASTVEIKSSVPVFPALSSTSQTIIQSPQPLSTSAVKDEDSALTDEDEMEEEAPSSSGMLNFGALGSFGLGGSVTPSNEPRQNPFGGSFATNPSSVSSPLSWTPSSGTGTLFRPASLSIPSTQQQPPQLSSSNAFGASVSGGFSGFGQPAQVGVGQQALGSVLGSFGQSRQFGASFQGSGYAPSGAGSGVFPSGAVGGFGGFGSASTSGGFTSAAFGGSTGGSGGGFSGAATSGGFAALASKSGGFSAVASSGGSGGFGGVAQVGSGGFGSFSSNQGSAFSTFGGGAGRPPAELLTQMRK